MGFPSINYSIIMPQPLLELLELWAQIKLMVRLALFYLGLFDPTDESSSWNAQRHHLSTVDQQSQPSLSSITSESIKKKLPIVEFADFVKRSGASVDEQIETVCAICLNGLEMEHEMRELYNCSHAFHVGCLDKWVDLGQVTCPMCRSKLFPEGRERKNGRDSWLIERIAYLFGEDLM